MNNQNPNPDSLISESDEDALDIRRIVQAVWLHKWAILAVSILVSVLVAFWAGAKPVVYEASATLLIEQGEASVVSIQDVYNQGYRGWEYMQTQFELLRSRSLSERVVRKLELQKLEQFQPRPPAPLPWYRFDFSKLKPAGFNDKPEPPWVAPGEEEQIRTLTSMVAGGVKVQQMGESNLVSLTFTSPDSALAARIANTYLEQYIESFLDAKVQSTLQATDWLNVRLADLRENLKRSEERLQAFRDQEQLVDIQGITTLSAQEISNLNSTYSESRQRRIELEATQQELRRIDSASTDELLALPAIGTREIIRGLKQKATDNQRIVNELSRRYGPRHPKMIDAVSQLNSTFTALDEEVKNVVFGIEREYQLARSAETSSKTQLDATKLDLQDLNRKEFMLRELEREVETNSQLYDIFFTRIKETGDAGIFEAPPARIIDLSLGGRQVGRNIRQTAMIAFVLAFALCSGLAVLHDFLDNTVKTPLDVEEKLGAPLLGALPLMKGDKDGKFEEYWQNWRSEFAESVRSIRTGVVLSSLDNPAKVVVVTSSIPGEGKSTLALNLACAFAQMEKTLVIGADLRRPSLARKCKLDHRQPGLSNYVAGSASLDECISEWGDFGLHVMPAGIIPSNPLELLSSRKFSSALEELRERYDRIIIDSAPVGAVSDALMLATYADALIFIVKADATSATLARRSIAQLTSANQTMTGVVLNHFDAVKAAKYYQSYHYRYNESYYNSTDTHG